MKPSVLLNTILFMLPLFFLGCQAGVSGFLDKPPVIPPSTGCKLVKTYEYIDNGTIDSTFYTYTGDHVSKVQTKDLYYTLDYNGSKIVRRNFFDNNSATSTGYDLISYNPDSTIKTIDRMTINSGTTLQDYRYQFTYTGGKLTKMTTLINDGNGQFVINATDSLVYTGNNITKWIGREFQSGNFSASATFTFDNKPNYFLKQNPQTLLINPDALDLVGISFVLFLSQNNMLSSDEPGTETDINSVIYAEDDHGNLSTLTANGKLGLTCFYQCP